MKIEKKRIVKIVSFSLIGMISLLCLVSGFFHILFNPFKDKSYKENVQTCFTYLIELFGRGSQVVVKDSKYIGFGRYTEEYYLSKPELKEVEFLKENTKKSLNVTEFVQLKYFSAHISSYQKDKISEKGKTQFYQTGLNNLFTTNKLLATREPTNALLEKSTNYYGESEFDYGSLLFSLNRSLTLYEINDHINAWNNAPLSPVLLTDSLIIKTGNDENAPCAFLKVSNRYGQAAVDTVTGYENRFKEKLKYLKNHDDVVQKLLQTDIFTGFNLNINGIFEFVEQNGIEIIGYVAVDSPLSSDSLLEAVEMREKDMLSKLVEVNNNHVLFK